MAQPRIVEVDYYSFRAKLKAAAASGARIEKTDGDRWQEYVRSRKVNLYTIQAWAQVRFAGGGIKLVIIDAGGDWDGVYAWSDVDERAARWESGESPEESVAGQDPQESVAGQDPQESVAGQDPPESVTGQDPEERVT